MFQGRSLETALLSLIEDFQRSTGIVPKWDFKNHCKLPLSIDVAIYRIVQEALTNICKYAGATEVKIAIETLFDTEPVLQVSISDNGRGFDINQAKTGFGLQGMQERTEALSGTIQILSAKAGLSNFRSFPNSSTYI